MLVFRVASYSLTSRYEMLNLENAGFICLVCIKTTMKYKVSSLQLPVRYPQL